MLTILQAQDLAPYADILATHGLTEAMVSEAKDGAAVIGHIVYRYTPEEVVIYDVQDGGAIDVLDGLVRAVLFKAELRGIEAAVFRVNDEPMMARVRLLGFVKNDENKIDNIADIMESCKKCGHSPANT